ncbi:MAG TPA: hypothetical protein VN765_00965 [Candidatus Acidoferrum sp.]|nr:hypothetical protein [Candidatus Acidoferrum sp.]
MKFRSTVKALVMLVAVLMLGTGCGGFYAAPTVSPLMFLLPGLAQTQPGLPISSAAGQTQTNQTVAQAY